MDVSAAIRINELSQELVRKGIAVGSEEASAMAERFLQKSIVHPNIGPKMENNAENTEIIIERMKRQVNQAFTAFEERMESMEGQIENMRNEMKVIKSRPAQPELRCEPAEKTRCNSGESQSKEASTGRNQRVGAFRPGDVSIESFFYCGDKKNG